MLEKLNFKNNFRIVKGGKISLVVSALVVSCALVQEVHSAEVNNTTVNTTQTFDGNSESFTVTNTGIININNNGDNNGIYDDVLYNGNTLQNDGSITVINNAGSVRGVFIQNSRETITNNNYIHTQTQNDKSTGISVLFQEAGSSIVNTANGTIFSESTGSGDAIGIEASISSYGDITNSGTITVDAYDGDANAISINFDNYGDIQNSGTITSTSANSVASGFYLSNTNYGNITNSGTIQAEGDRAAGIWFEDTNEGTITNSGSITAEGDSGYSMGFFLTGQNRGSLVNSGSIEVSGDAYMATGVFVYENSAIGTITNSGTISVNGTSDYTTGIHVYYDNSGDINNSGTINVDTSSASYTSRGISLGGGTIENSGTITATVNGEADFRGFSIYSSSATITNTATGKLYGNIKAWDLTNEGTISLPYNANSTNTAASINDFTNESTGTLQIGVLVEDDFEGGVDVTHSQLVTNNSTFEDGSTIHVNVLETSQKVDLLAGTTLEDVVVANNSGGSLTINGTLNIDDNSELLNFEYVKDGDTIDLTAVEGSTILDSTISGGGKSPAQQNAKALDEFDSSGMDDFKSALNTKCSTAECVAKKVDELEVKLAGAGVGAAKQTAQSIAKIVRQRQGTFGLTGGNSGEEMFNEKNMWFKPFGTWGEQNDKDGIAGYDVKSYGFGIGADGINKDDQQLGFGLFYTNADVDVNGVNQSSDVEAITILGYGSTPVIDKNTKLLYQVGYSWQMTDTFRETATGDAKADYTSNVASLDLKLMRDYQAHNDWLVQPTVGLSYIHFSAPSYSESGAGGASLDVDKFSTSETLLNLGVVSNYKIDDTSMFITTLDLSYDIQDKDNKISSTTQGGLQLADSDSIDNGKVSYAIGLGYEKDLTTNSNLNFTYEYLGEGSDYSNNTISAKFVYKF